jgi:HPt (histidine-containing phosphotransfer) domain-containing protein
LDEAALGALAVPDDPGAIHDLLALFASDLRARSPLVTTAAAGRDGRALASLAHALKGSASNLGARRLAAVLARIEAAAKAGDWHGVDSATGEIEPAAAAFHEAAGKAFGLRREG